MATFLLTVSLALISAMWHTQGQQFISETIPALSLQDFNSVPWSSNKLQLTYREHTYVYHNYTQIRTNDKHTAIRYLRREVIPFHRRVIRSYRENFANMTLTQHQHQHHERGFIANANVPVAEVQTLPTGRHVTWNWMRDPNGRCKVIIPFCFNDAITKVTVEQYLDEAFRMWHTKLGNQRGVEFRLTKATQDVPDAFCYNQATGKWGQGVPTDSVVVRNMRDRDRAYLGLGWIPPSRETTREGRMFLNFDPRGDARFPETEDEIIAAVAHEIGHVLGLEHEHQQYDASQHIKINHENVEYFENVDPALPAFYGAIGMQLHRETVINSYYWMRKMKRVLPDVLLPRLAAIVPFSRSNHPDEVIDFELDRQFDWDSIMLYDSFSAGRDRINPTMEKNLPDSDPSPRTWTTPTKISDGDARAVKRIYPDLV